MHLDNFKRLARKSECGVDFEGDFCITFSGLVVFKLSKSCCFAKDWLFIFTRKNILLLCGDLQIYYHKIVYSFNLLYLFFFGVYHFLISNLFIFVKNKIFNCFHYNICQMFINFVKELDFKFTYSFHFATIYLIFSFMFTF